VTRGSAFPWPERIERLGPRTVTAFARCARCPAGTHPAAAGSFVRYGGEALCLPHAVEAARGRRRVGRTA